MVALAGAFGRFHFAQQRVHFGDGEPAIGAHRAVAGHRRQQFVARVRRRDAASPCSRRSASTSRTSASTSPSASSAGTLRNASDCGPAARELEAERGERRRASRSATSASRSDTATVIGTSKRLRAQAFAVVRVLELLVADAFVRGVHVDDDQAVGVLGEDEDAVQLRDGETERRRGVVARLGHRHAARCCGERDVVVAPYSAA